MNNIEMELVERVKRNRDMVAFRELVLLHQKRVYYLIRKIVFSHEDSEDLVQETFIRSLKYMDQLRESARFGSWLSSIAVNLALVHRRKKYEKDTVPLDCDLPLEPVPGAFVAQQAGLGPGETVQADEIRRHLERALLNLPENQRIAFVMFHQHGMRMKEIAEIIGCPEVTVRTHVFRAVRSLRGQLKVYYQDFKE